MTLTPGLGSLSARTKTLLACASLAVLASCGESAEEGSEGVSMTGSSTVYPFAEKVAQDFLAANEGMDEPLIEQTGSSAGIEEFCTGTGPDTYDIVNASRRMTLTEFDRCKANGVDEIVEIKVGRDGIVFVSSTDDGLELELSPEIIYKALAANPMGEAQAATKWSEVDGSLPDAQIVVFGPPATSGTRDGMVRLFMEAACAGVPAMSALKDSDAEAYERNCRSVRDDSAYVDQGEDDDLIARKVASDPDSIGIFGYSYLGENGSTLKGLPVNGVSPTEETIVDGTYPGSRPLYIYVKKAHIGVTPGLQEFLDQWAKSWSAGGPLEAIGLVPASEDVQTASAAAVKNLTVLTSAMLASADSDTELEGDAAAE